MSDAVDARKKQEADEAELEEALGMARSEDRASVNRRSLLLGASSLAVANSLTAGERPLNQDGRASMAIVRGQFAFVGEIPLIGVESAPQGFVDTTTRAVPGLVHAGIHRRIDSEGIVIYEARRGEADDAQRYRSGLEGHLEKQRWYRPFGRWMNPGGVRRVVFMRSFRVISEAGAKDTVAMKLANLVELVVGQVPELKLAILHEGLDQPEEIMLYEEWDGTKAWFLSNEAPKPYRGAYREETAHLIAERGELEWFSPIRIYESGA